MPRKFALVASLTMMLFAARESSAVNITPIDLIGHVGSLTPFLVRPPGDPFNVAPPASGLLGLLDSSVFFNPVSQNYIYVYNVTPTVNDAFFFTTGFDVPGFTGTAGWAFTDSATASGCGGPGGGCVGDFMIQGPPTGGSSELFWVTQDPLFEQWDALESIRFFYVSTLPPVAEGNFNLTAGPTTGTAQGLMPAPEPGSLVLLGSGVVAVYAARRRRSAKRFIG